MDSKEEIAILFRQTRKKLGLSQQDVAKESGITQKTVSRIENGRDNSSIDSVVSIGRVLGIRITLAKEEKESK